LPDRRDRGAIFLLPALHENLLGLVALGAGHLQIERPLEKVGGVIDHLLGERRLARYECVTASSCGAGNDQDDERDAEHGCIVQNRCQDRWVKTLVMVAMLASCESDPKPPIANVAVAPATVVPTGWVPIEPDDERLHCANYARDMWQVAIDHGTLTFVEEKEHEADSGPALPFTPKQQTTPRGRQHVLAVSDGFLVGFDAGEWGGALYWFSKDGSTATKLADENVHGLVALGPDLVASVEGLSHLGISEGNVRWIEHVGSWRAGALTALDAGPRTFVGTRDAIYVVTTQSLMRVGKDRKAVAVQPVRTAPLYPDSMVIDAAGELWMGMRQFVVRMKPVGNRFEQTWLVRESCVRATAHDHECVCDVH
jgi:hypothetical protein